MARIELLSLSLSLSHSVHTHHKPLSFYACSSTSSKVFPSYIYTYVTFWLFTLVVPMGLTLRLFYKHSLPSWIYTQNQIPHQLGSQFMTHWRSASSHWRDISQQNHEQDTLETCLTVILARVPKMRPNTIMIDKCWTSYNAISNVVVANRQSWTVANRQQSQTHCWLLLCQLHAKNLWMDNLLPKVSVVERNHLYQRMCQLMHCITESTFNAMCEELKVQQYIEGGWCGLTCVWRKFWPMFGIMFNYGHVDTTKIVERHWHFIKYIALRGRINQSNTDLVHVLIGDNESCICIKGTIIAWYKQRQ